MARTIPREVTLGEKAWLAGILDGEGSICLGTPTPNLRGNGDATNRVIYGLYFVGAENGWIETALDIVNRLWDGEGLSIPLKDKAYKEGLFKSNKKMKQFCVRRQSTILSVLDSCLPFLTEKKPKAQNLYNFLKQREKFKRISDEEIKTFVTPVETKRTALRKEMKL